MRRFLGYRLQLLGPDVLIRSGVRMAAGLALMGIGTVQSIPVFIGHSGHGVSWWPSLIFGGFAWFLLGALRCLGSRIRRR